VTPKNKLNKFSLFVLYYSATFSIFALCLRKRSIEQSFFSTIIFRIFCCFDHGKLVILMNGFQKKSMKTPRKEILKALKIKEEYENSKK